MILVVLRKARAKPCEKHYLSGSKCRAGFHTAPAILYRMGPIIFLCIKSNKSEVFGPNDTKLFCVISIYNLLLKTARRL